MGAETRNEGEQGARLGAEGAADPGGCPWRVTPGHSGRRGRRAKEPMGRKELEYPASRCGIGVGHTGSREPLLPCYLTVSPAGQVPVVRRVIV